MTTLLILPQVILHHVIPGTHTEIPLCPPGNGFPGQLLLIPEEERFTPQSPVLSLLMGENGKVAVGLGKERGVRRIASNSAHPSYILIPTPSSKAPVQSSAGGLLGSSASADTGYLKLSFEESRNADEYESMQSVLRQFEALLLQYQLLDTRLAQDRQDDEEESVVETVKAFGTAMGRWARGFSEVAKAGASTLYTTATTAVSTPPPSVTSKPVPAAAATEPASTYLTPAAPSPALSTANAAGFEDVGLSPSVGGNTTGRVPSPSPSLEGRKGLEAEI